MPDAASSTDTSSRTTPVHPGVIALVIAAAIASMATEPPEESPEFPEQGPPEHLFRWSVEGSDKAPEATLEPGETAQYTASIHYGLDDPVEPPFSHNFVASDFTRSHEEKPDLRAGARVGEETTLEETSIEPDRSIDVFEGNVTESDCTGSGDDATCTVSAELDVTNHDDDEVEFRWTGTYSISELLDEEAPESDDAEVNIELVDVVSDGEQQNNDEQHQQNDE